MNCKNCQTDLLESSKFCPNCGAEVIHERISIKSLVKKITNDFFGWDNNYLVTIKSLVLQPEVVFSEYLGGTRKKYVTPFAFLAIGTALAMLVFNQFSEGFIELSNNMSDQQFDLIEGQFNQEEITLELEKQKIEQRQISGEAQKTILKFFNLFTFFSIPIYALLAFVIFGKPYNYAEHLIIACYIQGLLFLSTIFLFILSLLISPVLYTFSFLIPIAYYLYAYGRLNRYSFGQLILKLLKFLGIILVIPFLIFGAGYLAGSLM